MSKQSKMRWSKSDHKKLQQTVKKFNQKVAYHSKKHPDYILPNKRKVRELMGEIESRKDFVRLIKSMERFLKKGSEKTVSLKGGVKRSKWEIEEAKRMDRIDRAKATRERNKAKQKTVTSRGKLTDVTRAEMGDLKEIGKKRKSANFDTMSQKEFDKFVRAVEKRLKSNYYSERDEMYKKNYITGLIRAGYPDDIIEMVKRTPPDKFIEVIESDTEATFDFIYDPIELEVKVESLRSVWSSNAV